MFSSSGGCCAETPPAAPAAAAVRLTTSEESCVADWLPEPRNPSSIFRAEAKAAQPPLLDYWIKCANGCGGRHER
jgi:hypothetical protein